MRYEWSSTLSLLLLLVASITPPVVGDDWPQWRGPRRDGSWNETGVIDRFDSPKLDRRWRVDLSSGYSGPTVARGRVYVTDRVVTFEQTARVHCFDADTGESLWTHAYSCAYRDVGYDAGPRASVLVHDGLAYSLGTMGHFFCFDAATGAVQWQKNVAEEFDVEMPIWGLAASPLVEDNLVILHIGGQPDASFVAFDRRSGALKWRSLPDKASYAAPIVIDQAGKRVLIGYTASHVVGLDPGTGAAYWTHPFPPRQVVIGISTPVVAGDRLFLTNFFDGSLMLRLRTDRPGVEELWKRAGEDEKNTDALHSIISTPLFRDDHIFGVDSYGELRCLEAANGNRVWEDRTAVPRARWATIHFVTNRDKVWMFNERGELIIAELSSSGYRELSRAQLIDPTLDQLREREGVCWSHPAFAMKRVFARNDKELVCADLARR
jgi:outer membrane protein assembly factor BamB